MNFSLFPQFSYEPFFAASNDAFTPAIDEALPLDAAEGLDRDRLAMAEALDFEEIEAGYWKAA
jgi:hypothetical protein